MTAVKQTVLLLLLLGAVVSNAETEGCDALPKHLNATQLDKIFGEWVLAWSVADNNTILMDGISSSHVEFKQLTDNRTIMYNERNLFNSSCTSYFMNVTVDTNSTTLTLHSEAIIKEIDGVADHYNKSGEVEFFEACEDCLLMMYREQDSGRYLLSYRREGSHRDMDQMKAAHDHLKKVAECLKFPTDQPYAYDGVSDFCHKKSAPEAKPADA